MNDININLSLYQDTCIHIYIYNIHMYHSLYTVADHIEFRENLKAYSFHFGIPYGDSALIMCQ